MLRIKNKFALSLMILGVALILLGHGGVTASADGHFISVIKIDGVIDPVSERYLSRAIETAERDQAELIVIQLDTPGGLLSSTRDMVEAILASNTPVAVYVSPAGARAASAGTFITAAANFAAMAPGTNIGAASPIASGGQDLPSTLEKKVNEDTRAFIRSIAAARGRNSQALEETVTLARSYSANEAINLNIVDHMAVNIADLLAQLDGATAQTAAGEVVLNTKNIGVREIKKSLLEIFLGVISNPNLAFLLLTIGGLGILAEFMTPGLMGPGIVGAIALALAFLGMGQLSVNWIGVGLILFAMVLFLLEGQEAGIGIFGVGGVVCFVLGAFLLFGGYFSSPEIPEPGSRISVWLIGIISGSMITCLAFFLYLIRPTGSSTGDFSGAEGGLVGQLGVAISNLNPTGRVMVSGQEWTATTDPGDTVLESEDVRIVGIYGRDLLKVSRAIPERKKSRFFSIGKFFGGKNSDERSHLPDR